MVRHPSLLRQRLLRACRRDSSKVKTKSKREVKGRPKQSKERAKRRLKQRPRMPRNRAWLVKKQMKTRQRWGVRKMVKETKLRTRKGERTRKIEPDATIKSKALLVDDSVVQCVYCPPSQRLPTKYYRSGAGAPIPDSQMRFLLSRELHHVSVCA